MPNGLFTLKQVNQAIAQSGWVNQKTPAVNYLVVAGGGGGGYIGGAGAGGLLQGSASVVSGSAITVTIGAGGSGGIGGNAGTQGQNSVFGSVTAIGGGQGIDNNGAGGSGGSGAANGVNSYGSVGQGVFGQGNNGGKSLNSGGAYYGAGGGGAGTVGVDGNANNCGAGGAGIASAISGTVTTYAGGGGGGYAYGGNAGAGGVGGGGAGGSGSNAGAGTANTGGGGGSESYTGSHWNGGAGGSGIVILSYPDVYAAATSTTGSPTVSTSGSGSLSMNGSSQYVSYPSDAAFAFGTGDFTIEAWIYPTSTSNYRCIFTTRGTASTAAFFGLDTGVLYPVFYTTGAVVTSSIAVTLNAWTHVALVRSSGTATIYVNGVSGGSAANSTNMTSNTPTVGYDPSSSGYYWPGYMSNLRVVKGTAVYTSAFTPSTAPLTAISGTSLLLNTVSSTYLLDSSTNCFTPTPAGSPTWNSASPFATGLGYKNRVYTWTSSGTITF